MRRPVRHAAWEFWMLGDKSVVVVAPVNDDLVLEHRPVHCSIFRSKSPEFIEPVSPPSQGANQTSPEGFLTTLSVSERRLGQVGIPTAPGPPSESGPEPRALNGPETGKIRGMDKYAFPS